MVSSQCNEGKENKIYKQQLSSTSINIASFKCNEQNENKIFKKQQLNTSTFNINDKMTKEIDSVSLMTCTNVDMLEEALYSGNTYDIFSDSDIMINEQPIAESSGKRKSVL